ncbi:MAG: response regulator [Lachnospiraceae bacterium]|nr:response regulator [Lachnospiraceae bacterium]
MRRRINMQTNLSDKFVLSIKIISFVILGAMLTGLIIFNIHDNSRPLKSSEPLFIEEWTVTDPEGNVFMAGRSYRNNDSLYGTYTVTSRLPEGIKDDSNFCFITGGDVEVYVGGELRKDFIASRDIMIPGGNVKRFYMLVPVSSSDSGAEVTMIRIVNNRRGHIYQETFVATDAELFSFLIKHYGFSLMLAEVLMIFSLVIVIISIVMSFLYGHRIEMLYGAMGILIISLWSITNSFLYPFIYGHYYIDGVMNYLFCLIMPLNLVIYVDALQHGRHRKIVVGILCLALINIILWPVLHFTGIYTFSNALLYIDMILGIQVLCAIGVLIRETVNGKIREYRYTAIGFAGFLICGLFEIMIINILPIVNDEVAMLVGLAFLLTLAVIQQIDDLKRISDERQKAIDLSQAKTRFLASMSHEIRTPINAVLGMNEMILRENRDPVIGDYAKSVKSSGKMLLMLVNDVLDFSKIEAGKIEIAHAEYRLSSVLRDIMPMLKERADEKSLDLKVVVFPEVPDRQISDEFRIRQMLINLTNNAIKYTDEGSVTILVNGEYSRAEGSKGSEDAEDFLLKLSVRDTGRGIREEEQKHLFEAFSRADIKKNRSIEGTGLGLAIVKSIVDSMGGTVSVESNYGKGSEFTVEIPVGVADRELLSEDFMEQTEAAASFDDEENYLAKDASVLAVDDTEMNLRIVTYFLKRVGIVPDLCDGGYKAVEMCRQKHYDLILLDHMMPELDGIETLKLIRETEGSKNKDTAVIVLTANALAGSRDLYLEAGFADYLTKPIDSSLLEQTVKKYLPADKVINY